MSKNKEYNKELTYLKYLNTLYDNYPRLSYSIVKKSHVITILFSLIILVTSYIVLLIGFSTWLIACFLISLMLVLGISILIIKNEKKHYKEKEINKRKLKVKYSLYISGIYNKNSLQILKKALLTKSNEDDKVSYALTSIVFAMFLSAFTTIVSINFDNQDSVAKWISETIKSFNLITNDSYEIIKSWSWNEPISVIMVFTLSILIIVSVFLIALCVFFIIQNLLLTKQSTRCKMAYDYINELELEYHKNRLDIFEPMKNPYLSFRYYDKKVS